MKKNKITNAAKAVFFGIITGFIFLAFILWWVGGYSDTTIPFAIFIGIIFTVIACLLVSPLTGSKKVAK